ncbi:MAG: histidinol-phosphate transaminase [Phycisphaerae bacterium]
MSEARVNEISELTAAAGVAGVAPYRAPQPQPHVDLRLDSNEGIMPDAGLLGLLRDAGAAVLREYPAASELEKLLAQRLGVEPAQVLVTAGADEALDRVCRAYLAPGRELVLPVPAFEMLERYARLAGAGVVTAPWLAGAYPRAAVLAAVTPRTSAIAVVSPNNPTGAVASAADLEALSSAAPRALLIVDAAYTEFADEDLTPVALGLPNAVVVRSLSKAWGLAGLRVGYAAGSQRLIDALRAAGSPYSVSGPSLALAAAWLERGPARVHHFVTRVQAERLALSRLLRELDAEPLPSQANFVLARFRYARGVYDGLAGLGIAVRMFPGRPELDGQLRITCPGDVASFDRLTAALRTVLGEPAGGEPAPTATGSSHPDTACPPRDNRNSEDLLT